MSELVAAIARHELNKDTPNWTLVYQIARVQWVRERNLLNALGVAYEERESESMTRMVRLMDMAELCAGPQKDRPDK